MQRGKGFSLRLSEEELEQARILARAQDRSVNSLFRSLLRQAINKSTVEIKPRTTARKQQEEYA